MLDLFDKIYASKEKGFKPAVIFLDIEKAFDTGGGGGYHGVTVMTPCPLPTYSRGGFAEKNGNTVTPFTFTPP